MAYALIAMLVVVAVRAQGPDGPTREAALEQEVKALKEQLAEAQKPKLTPEQQRAQGKAKYTDLFKNTAKSFAAEACRDAGGKRFQALVINGQPAVACEFELK